MSLYEDIGMAGLRLLPPEMSHTVSLLVLRAGLGLRDQTVPDPILQTHLAGLDLPNPIGLAAGYDKNAQVPDTLLRMGFGFVECGAVTPRPQPGNPKPRLFRLSKDRAVINRMGFNNDGLAQIATRLRARAGCAGIVGMNLGANKASDDKTADYVESVRALAGLASFFTVNISSPNTPGLRALQSRDALDALLSRVMAARGAEPVFLKVAPDLADEDLADISAAVSEWKIDALIVSNTTIERADSLMSKDRGETGGLSGQPLFGRSTALLADFHRILPNTPLIGVGGVECADTAYAKIRAGATAVQLYSALVYKGPGLIPQIKQGLALRLKADGFASVANAVGVDA